MADDNKKKTDEAQETAEESAEKAEEKAEEAEEAAEEAQEAAEKAEEAVEEVKEIVVEVKEKKVEVKKEEPKTSIKVSKKLGELISEIEKLSVLELSELVHALQDKFGVSAAPAMVAQAPAQNGQAEEAGPAEGQTTFNVILSNSGANKIGVIKALREINQQLGLKEAKDIADAPPKEILTAVNKETAEEAKQKLIAAGAQVELK